MDPECTDDHGVCEFGRKCTETCCPCKHPNGRVVDEVAAKRAASIKKSKEAKRRASVKAAEARKLWKAAGLKDPGNKIGGGGGGGGVLSCCGGCGRNSDKNDKDDDAIRESLGTALKQINKEKKRTVARASGHQQSLGGGSRI